MTTDSTPTGRYSFSFEDVDISSPEEAASLTTFPFRMPSFIPPGFVLRELKQWWPEFIDANSRARKAVTADFVVAKFVNGEGHSIEVVQGFFAKYHSLQSFAPPEKVRPVQVNQRNAILIEGKPDHWRVIESRPSVDWGSSARKAVSWEEAPIGDSPRYYSVASDSLPLAEVIRIAESVPE